MFKSFSGRFFRLGSSFAFVVAIFSVTAFGLNERVAIVMPTYNSEVTMDESIISVLTQTHREFRLYAVDDGSTDRTLDKLQDWTRDSRLKIVRLPNNGGPALARNVGIDTSLREYDPAYVAFIDSDDVWKPQKLERQIAFMQEHGSNVSFTAHQCISYNGESESAVFHVPFKASYQYLLYRNPMATPSVMIRRSAIEGKGFPNIHFVEDFAFWLDLLRDGDTANGLDENLVLVRKGHQSLSSNKINMAMARWKLMQQQEGLDFITALWYFSHYAVRTTWKYAVTYATPNVCANTVAVNRPMIKVGLLNNPPKRSN